MIDRTEIDCIKAIVNLKEVIGNDVVWKKEARSYGGTLKGPCPFCGGTDRFHAHPKDGNWWCRQCGRKGDVFGYWMQRYNVSFTEAYRALALSVSLMIDAEETSANTPAVDSGTSDLWQACQQASYPITFEWPGGERTIYHNADEAYSDLWARSMVKEAQVLGGVVNQFSHL